MKQKRKDFYQLLKEKGISVYSLADELGLTAQCIYRWINGTGTPKPKTILKLMTRLNLSAEEVLLCFVKD